MKLDYLLITATKLEQMCILDRVDVSAEDHCHGRPWRHGTLFGKTVLLVEGGIGQVNTAAALTRALAHHDPAVILQFGVGGAYVRSGLEVGDLAIATEECYGDTGVLTPDGWLDLKEMGFPVLSAQSDARGNTLREPLFNRIPLDAARGEDTRRCLKSGLKGNGTRKIAAGTFITVQQCSGVQSVGDTLADRYEGICENMEGAAAAHVSVANDIPFVEIRGISNKVVDRDLSAWDLPLAARRCQEAVELIVEQGVH